MRRQARQAPSRAVAHPVVCGTDFTAPAVAAATLAARLAVALEQPLILVHTVLPAAGKVRRSDGPPREAAAVLRREAARLRALGVRVTTELLSGHADEVLVARARDTRAALVVVGALGLRPQGRYRLGGIAERTAEAAAVPTLVVRQGAAFDEWLDGKRALRVLLGFDFTATAEAAADWVRTLGQVAPCEITVGHVNRPEQDARRLGVVEPRPRRGSAPHLQDLLSRQVADHVQAIVGEPVEARVEGLTGSVDEALVTMAADARSDLVVVGTHQRNGFERLWSGSVSRGVLREAPVAVAVVPAGSASGRRWRMPTVRRVLVAVGLRAQDERLVAHGCSVAASGGIVRLVHVTHPRAISRGAFETTLGRTDRHLSHVRAIGRRIEALRPPAEWTGLQTEVAVVACEEVVTGICQEAERFDADIVVVGTRRVRLPRGLLGSVADSLVDRLTRPVLVVNRVAD